MPKHCNKDLVSTPGWIFNGCIYGAATGASLHILSKFPAIEDKFPPYTKNIIKFAGKAPSLKIAAGIGALGGAKAGLVGALVINGLYNGATSNELNIAHPLVYGGVAGATAGYFAYTKKDMIKKSLPEYSIVFKATELFKTPTRSALLGGVTGAKLFTLAYLSYSYFHKNDKETIEISESPNIKPRY